MSVIHPALVEQLSLLTNMDRGRFKIITRTRSCLPRRLQRFPSSARCRYSYCTSLARLWGGSSTHTGPQSVSVDQFSGVQDIPNDLGASGHDTVRVRSLSASIDDGIPRTKRPSIPGVPLAWRAIRHRNRVAVINLRLSAPCEATHRKLTGSTLPSRCWDTGSGAGARSPLDSPLAAARAGASSSRSFSSDSSPPSASHGPCAWSRSSSWGASSSRV